MARVELTADEALAELCRVYSDATIDAEHEFTVRHFAERSSMSYSHASSVLDSFVTEGKLTVRRVRGENGRWVSAYRWAS